MFQNAKFVQYMCLEHHCSQTLICMQEVHSAATVQILSLPEYVVLISTVLHGLWIKHLTIVVPFCILCYAVYFLSIVNREWPEGHTNSIREDKWHSKPADSTNQEAPYTMGWLGCHSGLPEGLVHKHQPKTSWKYTKMSLMYIWEYHWV